MNRRSFRIAPRARRLSSPLRASALRWLICAAAAAAWIGTASAQSPIDKVSGEIVAHRREKRRPPLVTVELHRERLLAIGLDPDLPMAEHCALYTSRRLTSEEIETLALRGITIRGGQWTPPVPGRHAHGFYLARVDYDSLGAVRADVRIVRLESTEFASRPLNDLSRLIVGADAVHGGLGVVARLGEGVKLAVADTGIDLGHSDFPAPIEAFDVTDGEGIGEWGADVSNTVTDHGTHVAGTALGRGTFSLGFYAGLAPRADLYFYKIGNDVSGSATAEDEIEAIARARQVGCDVFSLSFGGVSTFMDGSSSVAQAIDAAAAAGMTVVVAAGNGAQSETHFSTLLAPGENDGFDFTVFNSSTEPLTDPIRFRVIWIDDNAADLNIDLACSNLSTGETLSRNFSGSSPRGTEARRYTLAPNLPPVGVKTYTCSLQNGAAGGATPRVHVYRIGGKGTFDDPDPGYTVLHPSIADRAIAVGAWAHRAQWTDSRGNAQSAPSLTVGERAPFSSLGPRIDGLFKPDLVAPGAATISARDRNASLTLSPSLTIDDDGLQLDGSGPANYYVRQGTSMSAPLVAGVVALMIQTNPLLTPAEVKLALISTASSAGAPDLSIGFGLIDALAAVRSVELESSARGWTLYEP